LRLAFGLTLAFFALAATSATAAAPTKAQPTDWTRTVMRTAAGGYQMGNPRAKVHLIEFGSMTCPHCRAFDEEGAAKLMGYVKTGKVSWEFRNFVRDPFDLAASLVARCNGAKGFFALTRGLYKDQPTWTARVGEAPKEELEKLGSLSPGEIGVEAAKITGLESWAAERGVAPAKSRQCLADAAEVKRLVATTGKANADYPDFKGTPGFVINGKLLDDTYSWDTLEPKLRQAIGGKG
jgi:protein-disulfide isomerase